VVAALLRVTRAPRATLTTLTAATLLTIPCRGLCAQAPDESSIVARLGLDRLRLTAVGTAVGVVKPTQIEPTEAYSVHADYGELAPGWRVVFNATFWNSRYTQATVDRFRDTLRNVVTDPSGDDTFDIGKVTVSDVALLADLRWTPARLRRAALRPYMGGGFGAHVVNAEGKSISGTFIERALDNITSGVAAVTGLDLVFFDRISLGMQARFDLLSGARYGSLRAVGSYIFGRPARPGSR
jgi:hypothetical protein